MKQYTDIFKRLRNGDIVAFHDPEYHKLQTLMLRHQYSYG